MSGHGFRKPMWSIVTKSTNKSQNAIILTFNATRKECKKQQLKMNSMGQLLNINDIFTIQFIRYVKLIRI